MQKKFIFIFAILLLNFISFAQHPLKHWTDAIGTRYDSKQPVISYVLEVDTAAPSSILVEMKLRNVPATFQIAMMAHPEYDDRYYRYVAELSVETKTGKGKWSREDSALWKIMIDGDEATIRYRVNFPKTEGMRSAWKGFMTATGGLVGGPHSFMYVVGATLAPSQVTLKIPNGWQIATGLELTSDPKVFHAPSVAILMDAPIFTGQFKSWYFSVDNIPHRVSYWSLPGAPSFDTVTLIAYIKKLVEETKALFGRLPYREYNFMMQDGAFGALEHNNSITIGIPASNLARGVADILDEMAHEYFHSWNLVRIHPVEYGDVSYKTPPLSKGLWFSEGLTMFYTDLLRRRAGIPIFDSTRLVHLGNLLRRYTMTPAYLKFSADKISEAAYGPQGMLGNYSASTHLQGEVLGAMLDLVIRDATNGKRSMDDVMRKMMERFSGEKGFVSKDIEQAVKDVCGCDVHSFFQDHVYGFKQIDFSKYLGLVGLRYTLEWKDVMTDDGKPVPDLRVFSYQAPGEQNTRLGITNITGCWAKAGLNTGDIIKTVNGTTVTNNNFRTLIRNAKPGDVFVLEVVRGKTLDLRPEKINVLISGYQQAVVKIFSTDRSEKQVRLFKEWNAGK